MLKEIIALEYSGLGVIPNIRPGVEVFFMNESFLDTLLHLCTFGICGIF